MINTYTINAINRLDKPSVFPPTNRYKIIVNPEVGSTIQASKCKAMGMSFSYKDSVNSNTKNPSRFQWEMIGLNNVDQTPSGFKEFPVFYKIVFEDSTNPNNDSSWLADETNKVFLWIYFGKNETSAIQTAGASATITIDIDSTLITEEETIDPIILNADKTINTFNF